jgi:hypothetical protein
MQLPAVRDSALTLRRHSPVLDGDATQLEHRDNVYVHDELRKT